MRRTSKLILATVLVLSAETIAILAVGLWDATRYASRLATEAPTRMYPVRPPSLEVLLPDQPSPEVFKPHDYLGLAVDPALTEVSGG